MNFNMKKPYESKKWCPSKLEDNKVYGRLSAKYKTEQNKLQRVKDGIASERKRCLIRFEKERLLFQRRLGRLHSARHVRVEDRQKALLVKSNGLMLTGSRCKNSKGSKISDTGMLGNPGIITEVRHNSRQETPTIKITHSTPNPTINITHSTPNPTIKITHSEGDCRKSEDSDDDGISVINIGIEDLAILDYERSNEEHKDEFEEVSRKGVIERGKHSTRRRPHSTSGIVMIHKQKEQLSATFPPSLLQSRSAPSSPRSSPPPSPRFTEQYYTDCSRNTTPRLHITSPRSTALVVPNFGKEKRFSTGNIATHQLKSEAFDCHKWALRYDQKGRRQTFATLESPSHFKIQERTSKDSDLKRDGDGHEDKTKFIKQALSETWQSDIIKRIKNPC